jgi:hypothetical protein
VALRPLAEAGYLEVIPEIDVVNRPYHTLSVPDNMISESLLVLILQKPACGRLLPRIRSPGS